MSIHVYAITSDDSEFTNEQIASLETVDTLPIDTIEVTREIATRYDSEDFFAANRTAYRIYQDEGETLYFVSL